MKKLIFACVMTLGAAAALQAQDTTATQKSDRYQTPAEGNQDAAYTDKEAVAEGDLPSAIQTTLRGSEYTGWTVAKAFRKTKDGQPIYSLELKNGSETKKLKMDAQGKVLKEKDKK